MEGWQTQAIDGPASKVECAWQLQVTVLLPAYNERDAIQRVLGEIVEALADENHCASRSLWSTMPRPTAPPTWPSSLRPIAGNAR